MDSERERMRKREQESELTSAGPLPEELNPVCHMGGEDPVT